jgi:hypothetical protein
MELDSTVFSTARIISSARFFAIFALLALLNPPEEQIIQGDLKSEA